MMIGLRILLVAAVLFGGYFLRNNVRRDNRGILLTVIIFGTVAAIAAMILNDASTKLLHLPDVLDPKVQASTQQLSTTALMVVLVEETVKFVPIAIYLKLRKRITMLSDGILYLGLTGLVFGSIEHFLYGAGFGEVTLFVRLFLVLFLHAGLTGMVGYFFAKDVLLGNRFRTVLALAAAMLLHYIYDFCLFVSGQQDATVTHILLIVISSTIATSVNLLLIWLFYVSSQRDWKRLQQT